ncbi:MULTISPECIES: hypothetical protein [unclassified Mesorhizobium]|uniref:hypothetical protein n=1 Tax=unclassified Mesorhizobium TaxID=325217 RepID=UPI0013EC92A9|nr:MULTISPECIES: hypothetical protein [unclassified Mesorhizobium]
MALPLIALLPGISPRMETGRKEPSRRLSPISNVAEQMLTVAIDPFSPSLYEEKVPAGG